MDIVFRGKSSINHSSFMICNLQIDMLYIYIEGADIKALFILRAFYLSKI